MQAYFKVNSAAFQIPEKKNLVILIADQAKLQASLNARDADLQSLYNQNQAQFRMPERVHVRHILLKTAGQTGHRRRRHQGQGRGPAEADPRGRRISPTWPRRTPKTPVRPPKAAIWIGSRAARPCPSSSRRPSRSSRARPAAWSRRSTATTSSRCWRTKQARLKPFEEVKADLATQWKAQRVNQLMENISDKAQMALQKDPAHPEKVAARFQHAIGPCGWRGAGQPLPEIGTNADFNQAIADLKKGQVSAAGGFAGQQDRAGRGDRRDAVAPRDLRRSQGPDSRQDCGQPAHRGRAEPRQGTGGQGQSDRRRPGQDGQSDGPRCRRPRWISRARARYRCRHGQLLRGILLPAGWLRDRADSPAGRQR